MKKKRRSRQFKSNSQVIDIEEARAQRRARREKAKATEEAHQKRTAERRERTPSRKRAFKKKQIRRRVAMVIVAIVLLIGIGFSVSHIVKLKQEQAEIMAKQEQLKEEKAELAKELARIDDESNVEEQARAILKLIKKGEIIYIPEDKK